MPAHSSIIGSDSSAIFLLLGLGHRHFGRFSFPFPITRSMVLSRINNEELLGTLVYGLVARQGQQIGVGKPGPETYPPVHAVKPPDVSGFFFFLM